MVDVAAVSSATVNSTNDIADRKLLADNLDTFLQLLITQLQNQDPLQPMDTNEFTAQLVQYSGVEQAVKSNSYLSKMVDASTVSASQMAVGYIGKLVTADGTTTALADGKAQWAINAQGAASQATFEIRDASGSVVASRTGPLSAGKSVYSWDGHLSTGQPAPAGLYTLTVAARDAGGATVPVSTQITGVVDGADFDGSEPLLDIGGIKVKLSSISQVSQAAGG